MLYVTPYLIVHLYRKRGTTSSVIYLLSGRRPRYQLLSSTAGKHGSVVTWLYKLTIDKRYYNVGSVIGIMTFIILAVGALFTYRNTKSL